MNDKAALVELYNGNPENYGNSTLNETNGSDGPSTSQEEPIPHQGQPPQDSAPDLPTYQESECALHPTAHVPYSITVRSPPPRPPPPQLNRPSALPLYIATQSPPTVQAHTATVIVNPPQPQQQTIIHQPIGTAHLLGDNGHPYFSDGQRSFTSSLFNCCLDCQSCTCGTFCSCCYLAALASKMGESTMTGLCCMVGLPSLRTKLRTIHNIHGSICEDIMLSMCCSYCMVCQMGREMKMLKYPTKCCCC